MATRAQPRRSRRGIIIATLLIVLFASNFASYFYTDVLWFKEVGLESVLWKSLGMQWGVGLAVGAAVTLLVWINLMIAARLAPAYGRPRFEAVGAIDPVERYREAALPYLKLLRVAAAVLIGFGAGAVAAANWQTFLLFLNRTSFGETDPQFGRDIGFYVFELPLYDLLAAQLRSALTATLFVTVGAHFLYGGIKLQQGIRGVFPAAIGHASVLLGLISLVRAVQYWLERFQLNFSSRGVVDGASYTDVHAQLPALTILGIIAVVSAVLFLINVRVRRISLPIAAVAIGILFSFVAGGIWPWAVQRFSVEPQELPRERQYIERNLKATRDAFDLQDVETRPLAASLDLDAADIASNQDVLQNIRVWDPGILQQVYEQLQAIRPYYTFPDVDIDRYVVDGRPRQVLLSARELSLQNLDERSQTWANLKLQYTHGYGMVASLANEKTGAGTPSFLIEDVPGNVAEGAESLEAEEARLYYGETFDDTEYSIVNSKQEEIDYPTDEGIQRSRYAGEGGVPLSTFGRRLAFAVREGDTNLILSSLITPESKMIYYRNVRDRVLRAAPFLRLDHDPYVANVDGRLTWILDGYTTTDDYPYSQRFEAPTLLGTTTAGQSRGTINYIRNSVKITVDAYDGTMTFYTVDDQDPLIAAWRNAFPDLFTDVEPSPELQAHFRYPEDLFLIQSEVFLTYHIEDANDFYSKEDVWSLPVAEPIAETTAIAPPEGTAANTVAPTYVLIRLPGEEKEEFLLARPFTPRNKPNMIAFMVGRSDPPNYGDLVTLQFPRQKLVKGPSQIHNLIQQDVEVSQTLTLLGQEGSNVSFGSMITLPIQESLIYVQPLFVTAENVGIPELKRVLVVFGEEVSMAETFEEALGQLFGERLPEFEPDPGQDDGEDQEEPTSRGAERLRELIRDAAGLYEQAQDALAEGDFEEYGRLIEQLGRLLEQAERISG